MEPIRGKKWDVRKGMSQVEKERAFLIRSDEVDRFLRITTGEGPLIRFRLQNSCPEQERRFPVLILFSKKFSTSLGRLRGRHHIVGKGKPEVKIESMLRR